MLRGLCLANLVVKLNVTRFVLDELCGRLVVLSVTGRVLDKV